MKSSLFEAVQHHSGALELMNPASGPGKTFRLRPLVGLPA